STDSVQSCYDLLSATKDLMRRHQVPTQNCVLAHVTIQMQALEQGAPMDLLFQSIAGSERSNAGFGVNVALLDEAHAMIMEKGTAAGPNRMYFETGQGS